MEVIRTGECTECVLCETEFKANKSNFSATSIYSNGWIVLLDSSLGDWAAFTQYKKSNITVKCFERSAIQHKDNDDDTTATWVWQSQKQKCKRCDFRI